MVWLRRDCMRVRGRSSRDRRLTMRIYMSRYMCMLDIVPEYYVSHVIGGVFGTTDRDYRSIK